MTNDKYFIFTNSGGNPVAKYLRILILLAVKCPHPGRGGGGGGGCGAGDGADHDNYQNTAHRTVALGLDIWHPPSVLQNKNILSRQEENLKNLKP